MTSLILQRIGLGVLTLVLVSLLIFVGTEILPGDVASSVLGTEASQQAVTALREQLGLNDPAVVRYARWIGGIATGDLGRSLASGVPIAELISGRLYNTFLLALTTAAVFIPISVGLGILAATYERSSFNRVVNVLGLVALSVPQYFIAYLMIFLFAVKLGWLPSVAAITPETSWSFRLSAMVLPALTMGFSIAAHLMRMTRVAIRDVMREPYIEMALLKGISRPRTVVGHALPNAIAPILNVVGVSLAHLVVGVVVVEVVFVYPGIGQLLVDAVSVHDVPLVQACGLIFAGTYVVINAVVDILAVAANPRLRLPK